MKVTHKVKVDMERREYPVHIDVVQMDANTRVLEVSLFSGGVPWNVPTDASVSLAFKKADGHGGWYDTLPNGDNAFGVDGNVVNVTLAPEVTTFAGRVDLSLVMQNPETLDQIASFPMVLMVAENPANGQQLSNDYFNYKTMTEVNAAIDAFAKQIGSFDGSLRPIDFTLTATNAANNNWSTIRDLPTNRIYRLPYNDHPVDFGMPYSGSKQSLLAVIGTGNSNWYTLYICADRDGAIWISYDDPASSDDVKWVSLVDDPADVQKYLYDLAKRGQTVARFRGTHIVKKKIEIPASMTIIGGEFIADPSFEEAIFSAGGDGCRLVNVTMKAPALDKTPHIFVDNGVATEAKDSNVIGLYSSGHNGLGMINCVMDKIIPMRINGGSMEVRGCKVTDCSMFVWATDCRITVADNEVSICDTGLDSYYHVYYLNKSAELVASNNRIRCDTTIAYWDVYHFMTAGNKGEYRATGVVDGDVVFGNFQRIIDTHYADIVLKNCKISNSNTEKWSEFQNLAHIKCRFEGCDLDYTGSVMSDRDLSAYPDAEIVYDCCNITLDDSLNRNRCYWRSNIVQHLNGVPALRDDSDVILCSFSIGGSPVGFVDENKYSTSSMSGDASIVGENGFSGKIIGNVVEFVDSPTNKELFVFKKFSGSVANNTFFGTNKGVISGSEYDGVFNNYIDGVGVFGNVDEQEVQRIVVDYLKENPPIGGGASGDDGGYYKPSITQTDAGKATFNWQASQSDMPAVAAQTVTLPVGPKGEKGDTGATGPKGDKGDTGATGAQGEPGKDGADGKDYSFDPTVYGLPVLELAGDISPIAVSKDNKVTLTYIYGDLSGTCTLKGQGATSYKTAQALVNAGKAGKFNYTINFDTAFEAAEGWGVQKKYCLKANWIDHSHSRNVVSAKLWGLIVKSRTTANANLSGLVNGGAVDGFPIVIMLNGEFHGLYTFNIPKDGWMFGLVEDATKTQAMVGANDHEPATQFKGELVGDESDFELEFVSDETNTAWVTTSLNRLINACIDSWGGDLDTTVAQYLDWDSAIDYYIWIVVCKGTDMVDKNYLLTTFDGTKWCFTAYDMDSTYGLNWDGSGLSRAVSNCNFEECASTHRVFELIKRFKTNALKARYNELRQDILSETRICNYFENFAWAIPSPVALEDVKRYPTVMGSSVNDIDQIARWVRQRLEQVDKWVNALPAQETPVEPEEPVEMVNLVPTSTDADGSIYNGVGYKDDTRLSSSGGVSSNVLAGSVTTGFMPYKSIGVVRIKGARWDATNVDKHLYYINFYDANKAFIYGQTVDQATSGDGSTLSKVSVEYDETTGVTTIDPAQMDPTTSIGKAWHNGAYFRINAYGKGADLIVTVNQEITA